MTTKEIEKKLESYTGAEFITPNKLAGFMGQKNVSRVKKKFLANLPAIGGTNSYFIPDVAKNISQAATWED